MDSLQRFLEESPIASKVSLPTSVVLRRLELSPEEVSGIAESGSFSTEGLAIGSGGDKTCELEVGGQCLARGRIVRKRGLCYFKVLEMGEGGEP
jgi:hypothetical protein